MIRIREAAAALIEGEAIRQEWLNLEFQMLAVMRGALDLNTGRLASISDEDAGRLFRLRGRVIEQVLLRLRSGEWNSQYLQAGSLNPTPLSADWWKQRNYLDPYNETVPWEDGELAKLMVEERASVEAPLGANVDAPPADKIPTKKRPRTAPARSKQRRKAKKRKRVDYAEDDAPLVKQMRDGLRDKTYSGPLNAARAFAKQAKGKGEEASKTLRLYRRIKN